MVVGGDVAGGDVVEGGAVPAELPLELLPESPEDVPADEAVLLADDPPVANPTIMSTTAAMATHAHHF